MYTCDRCGFQGDSVGEFVLGGSATVCMKCADALTTAEEQKPPEEESDLEVSDVTNESDEEGVEMLVSAKEAEPEDEDEA